MVINNKFRNNMRKPVKAGVCSVIENDVIQVDSLCDLIATTVICVLPDFTTICHLSIYRAVSNSMLVATSTPHHFSH